jgi:membrane protease subunit HflK
MFTAMYEEYALNPDITRSRMYYETISKVFPNVKIYINTGDGSSVDMLLPLETLVESK